MTKITVVMVDGGFRENFESLDSWLVQDIGQENYEVIWVEYFSLLASTLLKKSESNENLKLITLNKMDGYHSSLCFNEGIRKAKGEILVIADADVVVEKNLLSRVFEAHQRNESLVMYLYRYDQLQKDYFKGQDIGHLKNTTMLINTSNYGGCLTVNKKWLIDINGYEEHPLFSGSYHANGFNVYNRFKSRGLSVVWHPELKLYHAWHVGSGEGKAYYKAQAYLTQRQSKKLIYLPIIGLNHNTQVPYSSKFLDEIQQSYIMLNKDVTKNINRKNKKSLFAMMRLPLFNYD